MIYLDNSATTQPFSEVLQTFQDASMQYFGNPSSLHSAGMNAEQLLTKARTATAKLFSIDPKEVVYTSGGTEGNNLAIKGTALEHVSRGRHLITSQVEHPSVLEAFEQLENAGFEVTYLPVDASGRVSPKEVQHSLRKDTTLVSIMHVNNEIGTVQPVEEIADILQHVPHTYFHVDHVQGVGKVSLDFAHPGIDLCTVSGHKVHAVKGTGFLYVRQGVSLSPLFHGGKQEQSLRSGTENVPGIAALAKALRMSLERSDELDRLEGLKRRLMFAFQEMPGAVVNTPDDASAPHIFNVAFPGVKPEVVIQSLAKKGIHVSTKSACASKLQQASPVLLALGRDVETATSAIRVSLCFDTTEEEIDQLLKALHECLPEFLEVMGAKNA
ncbi:cysteine desulfurase [Salsuginibacillus halophilus]|uniref:Cysteine desulfurase n=1 Tax=Salsuginibacillus halophilus TaxID=517424 RepID=A0A2P8HBM4_9BACI|nr:cysteine desulfurase family protein [Salsuginibacillus halophilus]PSL43625.1 cysteine desulfurase [Salsuginibacillus halophilus]